MNVAMEMRTRSRASPSAIIKIGCDKETHQHHRTATEAIGEFAAAQLGDKRARAEEGNHQRGPADGDLALGCKIERQKRDDKAAKAVDERASPDQPISRRQALHKRSEALFICGHVFLWRFQ